MRQSLINCPVCGGELTVTQLHCSQCNTTLQGVFQIPVGPFSKLTPEQTQFLLNFVRCEGRFTRLQKELNLSYPTLRNRFNEIIRVLASETGDHGSEQILSLDEQRHLLRDAE
ncbi:MAG TPA: DUF2089 family protein [Anaerolineaceae bacterium]|nr:DUF2089 family protein [Anaerolineaceae bacterium]